MYAGYRMRYPTESSVMQKIASNQSKLRHLVPLEELCMRKIRRCYKLYDCSRASTTVKNQIQAYLSDGLKRKMMEMLMRSPGYLILEDTFHFVSLLVDRNTTNFDFRVFGNYLHKERDAEMWQKLIEEAVNLKRLSNYFFFGCYGSDHTAMAQKVVQLKNLQRLEMPRLTCKAEDLTMIAENLKMLRYLDVGLLSGKDAPLYSGLQALKSLEYLRVFLFQINNRIPQKECKDIILYLWNTVKLEKIKILGAALDSFDMIRFDNYALHDFRGLEPLGLEQVIVRLDSLNVPLNLVFPNLRALGVDGANCAMPATEIDFACMANFSALSELYINEIDFKSLTRMLKVVGCKLEKVKIVCSDQCDLSVILNSCLNLTHLQVTAKRGFISNARFKIVNDASLDKMQVVELIGGMHLDEYGGDYAPQPLPKDVLTQIIIKTPNVTSFCLKNIDIRDEEVACLVDMLEKELVFRQLESFQYHAYFEKRCIFNLLDRISAYCQKLHTLELDENQDLCSSPV